MESLDLPHYLVFCQYGLGVSSSDTEPQVDSIATTVSNWYAAAWAQALGLSTWESVASSFGGQALIAVVTVLNGRAGAKYHM